MLTGTDVLGDRKSVIEHLEIYAQNFDIADGMIAAAIEPL